MVAIGGQHGFAVRLQYLPPELTSKYMPLPSVCLSPAGFPLCFAFLVKVSVSAMRPPFGGMSIGGICKYRQKYRRFGGMSCYGVIWLETRKNPQCYEARGFSRCCDAT